MLMKKLICFFNLCLLLVSCGHKSQVSLVSLVNPQWYVCTLGVVLKAILMEPQLPNGVPNDWTTVLRRLICRNWFGVYA